MRFAHWSTYALACGLTASLVGTAVARHRAVVQGFRRWRRRSSRERAPRTFRRRRRSPPFPAATALQYATGSGVKVAVLDGGSSTRVTSSSRLRLGAQWTLDSWTPPGVTSDGIDQTARKATDSFVGHGMSPSPD